MRAWQGPAWLLLIRIPPCHPPPCPHSLSPCRPSALPDLHPGAGDINVHHFPVLRSRGCLQVGLHPKDRFPQVTGAQAVRRRPGCPPHLVPLPSPSPTLPQGGAAPFHGGLGYPGKGLQQGSLGSQEPCLPLQAWKLHLPHPRQQQHPAAPQSDSADEVSVSLGPCPPREGV